MILPRRSFLFGLAGAFAAPAIVKASSLMQVRAPKLIVEVAEFPWKEKAMLFSTPGCSESWLYDMFTVQQKKIRGSIGNDLWRGYA